MEGTIAVVTEGGPRRGVFLDPSLAIIIIKMNVKIMRTVKRQN
jgi:hypothetical protein